MGKIWNSIKDSFKQTAEEQKAKFTKPDKVDENGFEVKENNDDDLFQGDNIVELEQDDNGVWNEPVVEEEEPQEEPVVTTPTASDIKPEKTADNLNVKDLIGQIDDSTDLKQAFSEGANESVIPDTMNIGKKKNDLPDVKLDLSGFVPSMLLPKNLKTEEMEDEENKSWVEAIDNANIGPAPTEAKVDKNGNIGMYFHKGDEPKQMSKEDKKKADEFLGEDKVEALNKSAADALEKGEITYVDENGETVTKDFNMDKQLEAIKKGGEVDENYDLTQKGKYERAKNTGRLMRKALDILSNEDRIKQYINDPEKRKEVAENNKKLGEQLEVLNEKLATGEITVDEYGEASDVIYSQIDQNLVEANRILSAKDFDDKMVQTEYEKRLAENQAKNKKLKEDYEKGLIDYEEYNRKSKEFMELTEEYHKYNDYVNGKGDSWKGDPVFEEVENLKGIKEKYQKQLDDFKAEYGEASKEIEENLVEAKDVSKQKSIIVEDYEKKIENHKKDEPKNKTSKKHEEWERQLNILEGNLVDAQGEYDRVAEVVTETENNLNEVNAQVADMQSKLDETNKAIETKIKNIEQKADELATAYENNEIGKMSRDELDNLLANKPVEPEYLPDPTLEDVKKELGIDDTDNTISFSEVSDPTGNPDDIEVVKSTIVEMNDGFATDVEVEQFQKVLDTTPQELLDDPKLRNDVNASLDYVNAKYEELNNQYEALKKVGKTLTRKQKKEYDYWRFASAELNRKIGATAADSAYVAALGQDENDYKDLNVFQKVGEWFDDKKLARDEKDLMELAFKATGDSVNANPAMLSKMTDTQIAILSVPAGAKHTIDSIVESPEMYEGAKVGWETTKQVFKEIGQGLFGTESIGETLFDLTMTGQRVYDRKQYAEAIDALFDGDFETFKNLFDDIINEYEVQSGENNLEGTENIRYYMEQADANVGTPGKIKNITKMSAGLITFIGGGFIHGIAASATVMNNGIKAIVNGANDLFYSFEDKTDENIKELGKGIGDLNDIIKPDDVEEIQKTVSSSMSVETFKTLEEMFEPDIDKDTDVEEDTTTNIIDETEKFNPGEGLDKVQEEELRKGFNRGLKENTSEMVSDEDVKIFIRKSYKNDPLLKMTDWRK